MLSRLWLVLWVSAACWSDRLWRVQSPAEPAAPRRAWRARRRRAPAGPGNTTGAAGNAGQAAGRGRQAAGAGSGGAGDRRRGQAARRAWAAAPPAGVRPAARAGRGGGPAGARRQPRPAARSSTRCRIRSRPTRTESQLWLRYKKVPLAGRLAEYQAALNHVVMAGSSATLQAAQSELVTGLGGLLGDDRRRRGGADGQRRRRARHAGVLDARQRAGARQPPDGGGQRRLSRRGRDHRRAGRRSSSPATRDVGVLRGAFALLRHLQMHRPVAGPGAERRAQDQAPPAQPLGQPGRHRRARLRRALALDWSALPATISQRYTDYARANASHRHQRHRAHQRQRQRAGPDRREPGQGAALADAFRPYGISRLPDGAIQRAHRDRRPDHRRSAERQRQDSGGRTR